MAEKIFNLGSVRAESPGPTYSARVKRIEKIVLADDGDELTVSVECESYFNPVEEMYQDQYLCHGNDIDTWLVTVKVSLSALTGRKGMKLANANPNIVIFQDGTRGRIYLNDANIIMLELDK